MLTTWSDIYWIGAVVTFLFLVFIITIGVDNRKERFSFYAIAFAMSLIWFISVPITLVVGLVYAVFVRDG